MGIRGLWPQIECIQEDVHIASLEHKTLAIDGYAFLHRGAHTCATELARGEPTEGYVLEAAAALAPRKRPRDEDSAGDAPARKRARVAKALRIVGTFAGAVAVAWIVVWGLVHV